MPIKGGFSIVHNKKEKVRIVRPSNAQSSATAGVHTIRFWKTTLLRLYESQATIPGMSAQSHQRKSKKKNCPDRTSAAAEAFLLPIARVALC
jgi:hypothetical protein